MSPRKFLLIGSLIGSYAAFAVTISVSVQPARCGLDNGRATANASGGIPPYTFLWSTGATSASLTGLAAGAYTVTVTDGLNNTDQTTANVLAIQELAIPYSYDGQAACAGGCSGHVFVNETSLYGSTPYSYSIFNVSPAGPDIVELAGLCPNGTQITITDATGCDVTYTEYPSEFPEMRGPIVQGTTPSCTNSSNGTLSLDQPEMLYNYRVYNIENTYDSIHDYWFSPPPHIIQGLPTGSYTIELWDEQTNMSGYCTFAAFATIGSVPEPCGSVSGRVFNDDDEDCLFNNFDIPLPYKVLTIEPGPAYAITDHEGQYLRGLGAGSYTIQQQLANEVQLCPTIDPIPFDIIDPGSIVVIDMADSSTIPRDLSIHIVSDQARPGFPTRVHVTVINHSAYHFVSLAINLAFDPILQQVVPVNGQWSLSSLGGYERWHVELDAIVPADISLLGTVLNYSATVTSGNTESNTVNNSVSLPVTVTGSYDPNDKHGNTSSQESDHQYFLDSDTYIDYTVRFQNTGTDTAFVVLISDMIDTDLDITSLEILGASHSFTPSFGEGRELVFTFNDIQLPDSTTDLLGSQGFISYRIKPSAGIIVGDVIENTAEIFFDFNPAIVTNTTEHVVDFSTGITMRTASDQLYVYPNPANDLLYIQVPNTTQGIDLFSMDGRRLDLPLQRTSNSFVVDVRELASGAYLVRTNEGTARFVK